MSKVVHFDASKLTPFVHENELKEMQAMVGLIYQLITIKTNLTVLKKQLRRFKMILKF